MHYVWNLCLQLSNKTLLFDEESIVDILYLSLVYLIFELNILQFVCFFNYDKQIEHVL